MRYEVAKGFSVCTFRRTTNAPSRRKFRPDPEPNSDSRKVIHNASHTLQRCAANSDHCCSLQRVKPSILACVLRKVPPFGPTNFRFSVSTGREIEPQPPNSKVVARSICSRLPQRRSKLQQPVNRVNKHRQGLFANDLTKSPFSLPDRRGTLLHHVDQTPDTEARPRNQHSPTRSSKASM